LFKMFAKYHSLVRFINQKHERSRRKSGTNPHYEFPTCFWENVTPNKKISFRAIKVVKLIMCQSFDDEESGALTKNK
jgi:hypothetical protein